MDVAALADVDDHGLAGVGQAQGLGLGLAELGPRALTGCGFLGHEIGELHPVEGEVTLTLFLAPLLDEEGKQLGVFVGATGVGLALIPDDALDSVAQRGVDDAGENIAGAGVAGEPRERILRRGCRCLARGFGGRAGDFMFFRGGFEIGLGLGGRGVGFALFRAGHQQRETRIFFDRLAAHPRLGGGTAPRVIDQPDGHIKNVVEVAAVEIADGAEILGVGRICNLPFAFEIGFQFLRADLRHGDDAEVGATRTRALDVAGVGLAERPLHVRLTGAHPDFAD